MFMRLLKIRNIWKKQSKKSKVSKVIVVGGGEIFNTYSDYIAWLKKLKLRDSSPSWKSNLATNFAKYNVNVIKTFMPNTFNAKYLEWKITFDKYINQCDTQTTLIGHSLGAMFLLKYLNENSVIENQVISVHLVAPQFEDAFTFTTSTKQLPNSNKYYFYQSKDDDLVTYENSTTKKIQELGLTKNNIRLYSQRGHFLGQQFPEIIEDILNHDS